MQDVVGDVHLNLGQFHMLVSVERRHPGIFEVAVSTRTRLWEKLVHIRRFKQLLRMARMPLLASLFAAAFGFLLSFGFGKGAVR